MPRANTRTKLTQNFGSLDQAIEAVVSGVSRRRSYFTNVSTPKLELAMTTPIVLVLAAGMLGLTASSVSAQDVSRVGTLSCNVSSGIGKILMEKQKLSCVFTSGKTKSTESYSGSIDEFGVAIGEVKEGHLIWGVLAADP